MNNAKQHQKLVDDLLYAVGRLPNVRVWPRVVGVGRAINNSNHVIRFGIPGESDIDGIVAPTGRKLSIEVKTGSGALSKEQQRWRNMIVKFGGLHIEARSVEQVLEVLREEGIIS